MFAAPFPVTSAPGARPQESAGRLINAYAVKTEQGARGPLKWLRAPGLRELANVIEHATILCDEGTITAAHLPSHFNRRQLTGAAATNNPGPVSLRDLEMQAIYQALERNGGSKPKAADELGISLKTLYNKLNQASDLEKSA